MINNRIEEVKRQLGQFEATLTALRRNKSHTVEQAAGIRERAAHQIDEYYCQLFPQPLDGEPLLTPEEREVALDDMRERASCGDSEQEPSLDDCVYIGSVYQLEKDKTKLRASPQPLDDKELRETIAQIFQTWHGGCDWEDASQAEKDDYRADAKQILALLQPKIEEATCIRKEPVTDKVFSLQDLKEARRQERTDIANQIRTILAENQTWAKLGKSLVNFWQALKGGE